MSHQDVMWAWGQVWTRRDFTSAWHNALLKGREAPRLRKYAAGRRGCLLPASLRHIQHDVCRDPPDPVGSTNEQ
ncbi:hypothetical protein AAFF_G00157920 [Aldrovandia affinis]|uniref:Uncharacterized protein n=1 Tax=Aldrovandia affinis TaxID=143900 RepID=A0AAD7W7P6_9TELE|nr:hypothetical protein AAFF_G00157920 [Aldrovandia affinis]